MMRLLRAALAMISIFVVPGCGFELDKDSPKPQEAKGPFAVLINIDGALPTFNTPQGMLGSLSTSQYRLTELLDKAAADINVQEVVVHFGAPAVSMGRAMEIVEAVQRVTLKGKPVVCHIDAADNVAYWMAAQACPRIMVSPAGGIEALGLSVDAVYFRDLLASLGLVADVIHIGEYKDAAEPLTRQEMSPHARESTEGMLFELHRILVDGIAKGRKLDSAKVQEIMDTGPHSAKDAVALGLADEAKSLQLYLDSLAPRYAGGVNREYGKPPQKSFDLTEMLKLFSKPKPPTGPKGPKVALVPMIGPIMSGVSDELMGNMETIRDMEMTQTLGALARDDAVRAVVIRIDSPGGSPLASDNIWLSVRELAKTKPVVVSMGDVAASGGYYIASAATEVIAEPATLTGSIGVVGGKLVLTGAAEKLGVSSERIQSGKRAAMHSPFSKFNEDERAAIRELMTTYYDIFVDRVVEGRGLSREQVLAAAKGRVWTGSQALRLGLVNQLGGLSLAVARAQVLASLPATAPVEIRPKPKSFMEVLGEALSEPAVAMLPPLAQRHPTLKHSLALVSLLLDESVVAFMPLGISIH